MCPSCWNYGHALKLEKLLFQLLQTSLLVVMTEDRSEDTSSVLEGGAFWKAYDSWNGTNTFSQSKELGKHCTWWPLGVYPVVCGIFTSKSMCKFAGVWSMDVWRMVRHQGQWQRKRYRLKRLYSLRCQKVLLFEVATVPSMTELRWSQNAHKSLHRSCYTFRTWIVGTNFPSVTACCAFALGLQMITPSPDIKFPTLSHSSIIHESLLCCLNGTSSFLAV